MSRVVLAIFSETTNTWFVTSHLNWEEEKNDVDVRSLNTFLLELEKDKVNSHVGFFGDVNNYLPSLMRGSLPNLITSNQRTFINDEIRNQRSIDFVGFTKSKNKIVRIVDEFPEDQNENMALDKSKRILHEKRGRSGIVKLWKEEKNRCENSLGILTHECSSCVKGIRREIIEQQQWFNYPRILNNHLSDHSLIDIDAELNGYKVRCLQYNILAATMNCAEYYDEEVQPWVLGQERIRNICDKLRSFNADYIFLQEVDEVSRITIENLMGEYSIKYLKHDGREDGVMILYKNEGDISTIRCGKLNA